MSFACLADDAFIEELLTEDGDIYIPPHHAELLKYGSAPITMSLAAQLGKDKGKSASTPAGVPEVDQQVDDQVGSRLGQLQQARPCLPTLG